MYKLKKDIATNTAQMIIKNNFTFIPMDESNTDYQEYLEWLAEGNTPEEAE